MENNKKNSIVMFIIILILTVVLTYFALNYIKNIEEAIENNVLNIIPLITISFICISIIFSIPLQKIFEKIYVNNNEKKIEKADYIYYREIIKKYSIGAIAQCYGEKIDSKDFLVAMMLKLIIKKKIKIVEDRIVVLNEEDLEESEMMFIKACKGVRIYLKEYLKNQIDEDCYRESMKTDLFDKSLESSSDILKSPIYITYIILIVLNLILLVSISFISTLNIALICIAYFAIFIQILLSAFSYKRILCRTTEGIELQQKLIGLKNFLKDYSMINSRDIKEIELWDEYMIYAILFNLKGNLNKQAYELYRKVIDELVY